MYPPKIHLTGDSELVVNWFNGNFVLADAVCRGPLAAVRRDLALVWETEVVQPKQPHESFIDWVPREFNTWADKFAKDCLRMKTSDFISFPCEADILCIRGAWDGARNQHGLASAAWWLQFATDVDDDGQPLWQQACSGCIYIR